MVAPSYISLLLSPLLAASCILSRSLSLTMSSSLFDFWLALFCSFPAKPFFPSYFFYYFANFAILFQFPVVFHSPSLDLYLLAWFAAFFFYTLVTLSLSILLYNCMSCSLFFLPPLVFHSHSFLFYLLQCIKVFSLLLRYLFFNPFSLTILFYMPSL